MRPTLTLTLTCLLATLAGAARADGDLTYTSLELGARVRHALLPGGTVYDETTTVSTVLTDATVQTAEHLHLAPTMGFNLSGRSPTIVPAFGSALAESDGNGGVGVSAWLAGNPGAANVNTNGELVALASWTGTMAYAGLGTASATMHLVIPALEVGLIGVAPNRDGVSTSETARATVRMDSLITHADGSFTRGGSFGFGLSAFEVQYALSPGVYGNFGDVAIVGTNSEGFVTADDPAAGLFSSLSYNGNAFNPRWSLDAVSTTLTLGELAPGDVLSFVYVLTAQGTTHGGEHGFLAFLGDPFELNALGGSFLPGTQPVPEPETGRMLVAGLGLLAWAARRSRPQA